MKNEEAFDIDLQWFAGDGAGDGGSDPGAGGEGADPPSDVGNLPAAPGASPGERTFSQEEVNAILAKNKGKEAARILKEMGIDDVAKGKEALNQLAEWKKEKMGKEELLAEENEKLRKENEEYLGKNKALEARNAALSLGVDTQYLMDVVKLVPDGEEPIEERMKAFLKERPMYLKKAQGNLGGQAGSSQVTDEEKIAARLRKSMDLA